MRVAKEKQMETQEKIYNRSPEQISVYTSTNKYLNANSTSMFYTKSSFCYFYIKGCLERKLIAQSLRQILWPDLKEI